MPADIFLETTARVDLHFRSPALRKHIIEKAGTDSAFHTSRYVIFELARGFLTHLLTLHNKATDLDSFSDLIQYVRHRNIGGQYRGQTMLGAYEDFLRHLEQRDKPLTVAQDLLHFRAWLAPFIRRGWRAIQSGRSSPGISNPIGCRDNLPAPVASPLQSAGRPREHFRHDIPKADCGKPDNCRLLPSLQSAKDTFAAVANRLREIPNPDAETSRRIGALDRLLASDPAAAFARKDCYACGDPIIAHEAASDHTVLSKNERHMAPICSVLKKNLLTYTEPKPSPRT